MAGEQQLGDQAAPISVSITAPKPGDPDFAGYAPNETPGPSDGFTTVPGASDGFTTVDDDALATSLGKSGTSFLDNHPAFAEFVKQQPIHPAATLQMLADIPAGLSTVMKGMPKVIAAAMLSNEDAARHPNAMNEAVHEAMPDAIKSILAAQDNLRQESAKAFKDGDTVRGVRKFAEWLIPILGPALSEEGDNAQKGEYAKSIAGTLGIAMNLVGSKGPIAKALDAHGIKGYSAVGPEALAKQVGAQANPLAVAPEPAVAARVAAYAAEEPQVPLTLGEKTGIPLIKGAEKWTEQSSLAGAMRGKQLRSNQVEGMVAKGNKLVQDIAPDQEVSPETAGSAAQAASRDIDDRISTAYGDTTQKIADRVAPPATPLQAGEATIGMLDSKMAGLHEAANKYYGAVRDFENDPQYAREVVVGHEPSPILNASGQSIGMVPVTKMISLPVTIPKGAFAKIYEVMERTWPLVRKEASPAYTAIKQLVEGPNVVPLSEADRMLSAVKTIAREQGGLALKAVAELHAAVSDAATEAGSEIMPMLDRGRAATKAKYAVEEVLASLKSEPGKAFGQMVEKGDKSIELLRTIAREVPEALPMIARAYLQDLFEGAVRDGQFDLKRAATLANKWLSLGDETKKLLFKDPSVTRSLDELFVQARRIADKPVTPSFALSPVSAFDSIVAPRDTGIWRLNAIKKVSPNVLPMIGRAWVQQWLDTTMGTTGLYEHGAAFRAAWDKLGPRTKTLLFGEHANDIDNFVRLGDSIQWKNTNSQTAMLETVGGKLSMSIFNPLKAIYVEVAHSALGAIMFNPRAMKALTKAIETPKTNAAASASASAKVLNFIREAGLEAAQPARVGGIAAKAGESLPRAASNAPPPPQQAGTADELVNQITP